MADKKTSQVQHDLVERMESAQSQATELERKGMEQMTAAIEEGARLMKEALAWQVQINAEWRKLALDATRKMNVGFGIR